LTSGGQCDVELKVLEEHTAGVEIRLRSSLCDQSQPVDVVFLGPLSGHHHHLVAEKSSKLEDIANDVGKRVVGERNQVRNQVETSGLHEVLDPCAIALPNADQPQMFKFFKRFPQRCPVDSELFGEIALRGEFLSGHIFTREDQRPKLFDDFVCNALFFNGFEH